MVGKSIYYSMSYSIGRVNLDQDVIQLIMTVTKSVNFRVWRGGGVEVR